VLAALGVVVVGATTVLLGNLDTAAPHVDRNAVWIDNVRRGPMLREVRGIGSLVPEDIRWVATQTSGRIDHIEILPGALLPADAVVVVLSNQELLQSAEAARWALRAAEAEQANQRAQLEGRLLELRSGIAQVEAAMKQAQLEAEINEALFGDGLVADLTLKLSRVRADELATRYRIEQQRLEFQERARAPQLAVVEAAVEQARARHQLLAAQVDGLRVRARTPGVLQRMSVTDGEQVVSGQSLFQIANPEKLKAVIRIPETQARDVQIGQKATIDTRNGVVAGQVVRVDPNVENGTVAVDVRVDGGFPRGARPDLTVEGRIELERLDDVLHVGRPAFAREDGVVGVFKFLPGSDLAVRTPVRFGRQSVSEIEILDGLLPGDRIILSDTSAWDDHDRLRVN